MGALGRVGLKCQIVQEGFRRKDPRDGRDFRNIPRWGVDGGGTSCPRFELIGSLVVAAERAREPAEEGKDEMPSEEMPRLGSRV